MADMEKGSCGAGSEKKTVAVSPYSYNTWRRVRIWQGILEIVLRSIALLLVILVFVSAATVFRNIHKLEKDVAEAIDSSAAASGAEVPLSPLLVILTRVHGAFLMSLGLVLAIYEILATATVPGFLYCSTTKNHIILVFKIVDMVLSGAFVLVFLIAGGASGVYSWKWHDWVEYGKEYGSVDDVNLEDSVDTFEHIRDVLKGATVLCIVEALVFLSIAVWLLISAIVNRARPQQAQYTRF